MMVKTYHPRNLSWEIRERFRFFFFDTENHKEVSLRAYLKNLIVLADAAPPRDFGREGIQYKIIAHHNMTTIRQRKRNTVWSCLSSSRDKTWLEMLEWKLGSFHYRSKASRQTRKKYNNFSTIRLTEEDKLIEQP